MTDEWSEVQQVISKLPDVMKEKVVVGATRAAASTIAKEAKARVPVKTGLLKRSIGIGKAKKSNTPDDVVRYFVLPKTKVNFTKKVLVGTAAAKMKVKATAFYGHFLEHGTKKMSARPFLVPAAKASETRAVEAFRAYIVKRVPKELERLRR